MNRSHFLFIATLLLLSSISSAQKFGDGNPVWNYSTHKFWSNTEVHGQLIVEKQVEFKNKTCFVLSRNNTNYASYLPYRKMFCQDSNKVLFWSTAKDTFQVLYDFDAKKGESWNFWIDGPRTGSRPDSIYVKVDSTYTLKINNRVTRAQIVHFIGSVAELDHVVIEGIGSNRIMFPSDGRGLDADYVEGLRCFENDSIGLYKFYKSLPCDYTNVGKEETVTNSTKWSIFPNPNSGVFKINGLATSKTFRFTLVDNIGQVIYKGTIEKSTVDLEQLSAGIYLLNVFDSTSLVTSQKLIIHD